MGRHAIKSADGEGFLRAFWDAWKDLEADHDIRLALLVEPTTRKGIFTHRLQGWLKVGGSKDFPQASVRVEYPSSQVQTYEAFLYTLVVKLERVFENQARYPEGKA